MCLPLQYVVEAMGGCQVGCRNVPAAFAAAASAKAVEYIGQASEV